MLLVSTSSGRKQLSGLNWKFNPESAILLATPDPPNSGRIWCPHGEGFLRKPDPIFRNSDTDTMVFLESKWAKNGHEEGFQL